MIRPVTQKIGSSTYELTLFGSVEGQEVLVHLFKLLGPSLGPLMGLSEGDASAVGRLLADLAPRLTNDDLEFLIQRFGSRCTVHCPGLTKGPAPLLEHRDVLWAGKYGELFQWLLWAVKANYASFLPARGVAGSPTPQTPAPSSSQPT